MSNETQAHPFEKTLGPGPYQFVGAITIIKPCDAKPEGNYRLLQEAAGPRFVRGMGTCAHCNHAIMNVFMVKVGNGDIYGVGCDCIAKVGLPPKEMKKVERAEKDRLKQRRLDRKLDAKQAAKDDLTELLETQVEKLQSLPHPSFSGSTLLDYAVWVRDNVSNPVSAVAKIKKALKA